MFLLNVIEILLNIFIDVVNMLRFSKYIIKDLVVIYLNLVLVVTVRGSCDSTDDHGNCLGNCDSGVPR